MNGHRYSLALIIIFAVADVAQAGGAVARVQQQKQQQLRVHQQIQVQRAQEMMQMQAAQAAQQAAQQAVQVQAVQQMQAVRQVRVHQETVAPQDVKQIATLDDVLASLEIDSQTWPLIIDRQAKEVVISHYINQYQGQGVRIRKPPSHYVDMIDAMSQNPEMLGQPFGNIVRIVAVIEYDFSNGQDKDKMALQVLGSWDAVWKNKKRLGL